MSISEKITKGFFWFAFGAFLAMSIPHVAYIFRYYEPQHDGYDGAWWAVSYGVAIGIDLLICWLSYTRSEQHNTTRTDNVITWLFIVLLAALSWYCNWLFAELMTGINVWSFTLPMDWTVGSITPVIVSAIPVFLIAYTYMSKRILGIKVPPKSAEELEQEATELERKGAAKQRIQATKNQGISAWIAGKKSLISEALSNQKLPESDAKVERNSGELDPAALQDLPELLEETSPTFETREPEKLTDFPLPERLEMTLEFIDKHPDYMGNWNAEKEQELAGVLGLNRAASARFWRLKAESYLQVGMFAVESPHKRKYAMTYEEASEHTGYTISYLKSQVSKGEIHLTQSGKLKVSTLKIKQGNTGKIPVLREA